MELDEIYQDETIDSVESPLKDLITTKYVPNVELKEKKIEEADNFSARMSVMDEANGENPNKKSFLLFAKHYPSYHHYSYKGGPLRRLTRLDRSFPVLPEIKGQTLTSKEGGIVQTKNKNLAISNQVGTLHDLTRSILRYGGKSDVVWMKFPNNPNGEKLVRPGYSARRYMANIVKHLNDDLVNNLIANGRILEQTLFQSNLLLPHIRRRISTDLSRYPEPYRIIKQMLMSPGPLNEYSFIWKNSDFFKEEAELKKVSEMKKGDIKILSRTTDNVENKVYKEVEYAQMSREKQKTILSNLLLKSAMSHALKMKDKIIEHNINAGDENPKEKAVNIHIPIIKFDMMEAVTDLLNKETLETLSSDIKPSLGGGAFKGQALKQNIGKTPMNPDPVARPSQEKSEDHMHVITIDNPLFETEVNPLFDSSIIPNLTFRLHATNTSKPKKKYLKTDGNSGRQSALSNRNKPVLAFDLADVGVPDFQSQKEAQSNAYVERLKKQAAAAAARKELVMPYGKYRDFEEPVEDHGLNPIGDIDPTVSFSNWRYDEIKTGYGESVKSLKSESLLSSGHFANNSLFNSKMNSRIISKEVLSGQDTGLEGDIGKENDDHNRLIQLLSEHAGAVADSVLNNKGGGEDFASDVNESVLQWNEILKDKYFELFSYVAIMEILMQKKALANRANDANGQIWNLDVEDMKHQEEYEGMIKNIFKSIFKEQLSGIGNDDVNISPEIMALLQDGSKLALDHLEVFTDPTTGLMTVKLKEGVSIKRTDGTINDFHINLPTGHNNSYQSPEINSLSSSRIAAAISAIHGEPEFDGNYSLIESRRNIPPATKEKSKSRIISIDSNSHKELAEEARDLVMTLQKETDPVNNAGHAISLMSSPRKSIIVKMIDTSDTKTPEKNFLKESGIDVINKDSPHVNLFSVSDQPGSTAISNKNGFPKSDPKKSKHDFVVARVDDTKDIKNLYSQTPEKPMKNQPVKKQSQVPTGKAGQTKQSKVSTGKTSQIKQSSKKKANQNIQNPKKEIESKIKKETKTPPILIKSKLVENQEIPIKQEQENEGEEFVVHEENEENTKFNRESSNRSIPLSSKAFGDDQYIDDIPDEELSGDDEETKEKKLALRQNREAKRNAGADKRRLEVDRKRREKEEQRKLENKRREIEESMSKRLEEERHQREEEYRLKLEKEKEEELRELDAVKYQEYLRQKQVDRERREKEEFHRKLEEMKIKQALEDEKRREEKARLEFEEAERIRIENEMISRMREDERILYLKRKAEEENRKRIQDEEEKRVREQQAQLALQEAQRIAQQQARERALLEARLNFVKGLKIENVGMKKFLNITPTFVWSYFEFLKILGLQPNPTTNKLESDTFDPVN